MLEQAYTKTTKPIFLNTKFGEKVAHGPRNKPLSTYGSLLMIGDENPPMLIKVYVPFYRPLPKLFQHYVVFLLSPGVPGGARREIAEPVYGIMLG